MIIRHLIPRIETGPWGGAAITNDGSPKGDEANGCSVAVQWLGIMWEFGIGTVRPRPAKPTCATLPDDVTVDQAASHLGIAVTPYSRVNVAHQLVRAGFAPVRTNGSGAMAARYQRRKAA